MPAAESPLPWPPPPGTPLSLGPTERRDASPGAAWLDLASIQRIGLPTDGGSQCPAWLLEVLSAPVGAVLKADHRTVVERVTAAGRPWVRKRYRGWAWKARVYHAVRRSPAWREWWGVRRLARIEGLRLNPPLALVHGPGHTHEAQTLILPFIEGLTLGELLRGDAGTEASPSTERRRRIARRVGAQAATLIRAGVINRDHKSENLILDEAALRGEMAPVIIDLAGVRRRRPGAWGRRQALRMLATLVRTCRRAGPVCPRELGRGLRAVREVTGLHIEPEALLAAVRRRP